MNKVLIIAYIFPPIGGSGVQRTLKFARYLPQFDWQPIVVCGDNGEVFNDGYDPSLLVEIPPEAIIHRTHFRSPLALRRWIQQALRIKGRSQPADPQTQVIKKQSSSGTPADSVHSQSRLRRLIQWLSAPLAPFEFPPIDAALYWATSIIPLCLNIIKREKVDVIYTTSFPYSDHVAGYLLKRLTGKPWVADFRDPWTQNASVSTTGWRRRCDEWAERAILSRADRVIGVTPSYTVGLWQRVSHRTTGCFLTIENGYDPQDFPPANDLSTRPTPDGKVTSAPQGMVTVAHVGMAYDGTVLPLLKAIEHLPYKDQTRLRFQFIAGLPPKELDWLSSHPLSAEIEISGRMPHAQAIEAMQKAEFVFLPIGEGKAWAGHYPGKLFEYLACGTPILLIGADGDAARLIQLTGTGLAVSSDDLEGAVRALKILAEDPQQFKSQYYLPDRKQILRYERKNLTQQLASVFDNLTQEKQPFDEKTLHRHAMS